MGEYEALVKEFDLMVSYAGNQIAIPALKNELVINDKRVSGRAVESLYGYTDVTVFSSTFNLMSTDYRFHYATEGRGPGENPPIDPLKEWARLRGFDEGIAFGLSKKIGAEGTNPKYHKPETLPNAAEKFKPAIDAYFQSNVGSLISDLTYDRLQKVWVAKRTV